MGWLINKYTWRTIVFSFSNDYIVIQEILKEAKQKQWNMNHDYILVLTVAFESGKILIFLKIILIDFTTTLQHFPINLSHFLHKHKIWQSISDFWSKNFKNFDSYIFEMGKNISG